MHTFIRICLMLLFVSYSALGQTTPGKPSQPNTPSNPTNPKLPGNPGLPNNPGPLEDVELLSFVGPNYILNYPSNWELDTSGQNGTTMILFSPEVNAQDQFTESVSLIEQDLAGLDIDMDQYAALTLEQIEQLIEQPNILDNTRMSNTSPVWHKMEFKGNQDGLGYYYMQYYFLIKERAYLLSFVCLQSELADNKKTAIQIMDSFILETN